MERVRRGIGCSCSGREGTTGVPCCAGELAMLVADMQSQPAVAATGLHRADG
jgi:hypothetical protein